MSVALHRLLLSPPTIYFVISLLAVCSILYASERGSERASDQQSICPVNYQVLTHLEPQSRWGDKPLKFQAVCPQNGTAVLKGLNHTCYSLIIFVPGIAFVHAATSTYVRTYRACYSYYIWFSICWLALLVSIYVPWGVSYCCSRGFLFEHCTTLASTTVCNCFLHLTQNVGPCFPSLLLQDIIVT